MEEKGFFKMPPPPPNPYHLWAEAHFNHPLAMRWRNYRTPPVCDLSNAHALMQKLMSEMAPVVKPWALDRDLDVRDWFPEDSP